MKYVFCCIAAFAAPMLAPVNEFDLEISEATADIQGATNGKVFAKWKEISGSFNSQSLALSIHECFSPTCLEHWGFKKLYCLVSRTW